VVRASVAATSADSATCSGYLVGKKRLTSAPDAVRISSGERETGLVVVSRVTGPPSAEIVYSSDLLLVRRTKAIFVPSGDQSGEKSRGPPTTALVVNARSPVPSAPTTRSSSLL
jgi:hypothetical protein